ncbi:MAG: 50S ribosomal protein L10, partial [Clostridiales bacterium]
LDPFLEGPTAIAFSEDPVVLAKVFGDFMKTNKKMELKAGALGNQLLDANGIEALAKLPSKEVLLGQVAGAFQAPMVAFAGCAVALLRQLVTVTDAVREQKAQEA